MQKKQELDDMVNLGVIRPTNKATPVVGPMRMVRKNNKIRVCIVPTDLNKNILRRHYPLKTVEKITARLQNRLLGNKS